jgi:diacylglycerol kinase family enzyme
VSPGDPVAVDVGRANNRWFINAASIGFGAVVTANTLPELKRLLGGAAYTLMVARLAGFLRRVGYLYAADGNAPNLSPKS